MIANLNLETLAILFLASVFLLYLLKRAILRQLQVLSLLLFKTPKIGFWLYVVISWPGVVVHELSHWLMAEILQVSTGQIDLWPNQKRGSLGSVKTTKTDPFRGLLIGLAPFLSGLTLIFLLSKLVLPLDHPFSWQHLVYFYLIWTLSHGMLVSKSDLRFLPLITILFVFIFFVFYHFRLPFPQTFFHDTLVLILKVLGLSLSIGLLFLTFLIILRWLLIKIFALQKSFKPIKIKSL